MTESYAGLLAGGVLLGQRGLREGFAGAFLLGLGSTAADLLYIPRPMPAPTR